MKFVVFLRAVNVGGTNRCQPALIAKELVSFDVVNIGAVGTFVVRGDVTESALRTAFARKLPFKCDIMVCPARDLIKLALNDPFFGQPSDPGITRFVSVAAQPLGKPVVSASNQTSIIKSAGGRIRRCEQLLPPLPLSLPSDEGWLLKIIAIENRFVLGVYQRQMKAIGYLGKIEKLLGVPLTTRNWNTIQKVVKALDKKD